MKLKGFPNEGKEYNTNAASNDVKCSLKVDMTLGLHAGVHIQHPNGRYQYFDLKDFEPGKYRLSIGNVEGYFSDDSVGLDIIEVRE